MKHSNACQNVITDPPVREPRGAYVLRVNPLLKTLPSAPYVLSDLIYEVYNYIKEFHTGFSLQYMNAYLCMMCSIVVSNISIKKQPWLAWQPIGISTPTYLHA